jgi:hypothetical protein
VKSNFNRGIESLRGGKFSILKSLDFSYIKKLLFKDMNVKMKKLQEEFYPIICRFLSEPMQEILVNDCTYFPPNGPYPKFVCIYCDSLVVYANTAGNMLTADSHVHLMNLQGEYKDEN